MVNKVEWGKYMLSLCLFFQVIDVFPKGVWFQRFSLIVWQGTVDVPEQVLKTIRISITAKDVSEDYLKVKVSLYMYVLLKIPSYLRHFTL